MRPCPGTLEAAGGCRRALPVAALALIAAAALAIVCGCAGPEAEAPIYPGATWMSYADPEEAGWSSEGLEAVKAAVEEVGSDAFMAVYDGAVLVACGDPARRYMCHSVRKSYLSALYGIYAAEGAIDLDETLEELGIDDVPPLTPEEKGATVRQLLQSRSGVYHAAAYETPKMKERRPERGSKQPGEFWYYNNWDFNALCTIFEKKTGKGLFEAFERRIADPLGMEDFRLMDTYYHLEKQHSIHPAYPFRMSARDMARFGLLFLRKGRWDGEQIVPEEWVAESTTAYSRVPYWDGHGYGYLWWVNTDESDRKFGMYAALGYGGHMIAVLPSQKLVIVNRMNTYVGETASRDDLSRLVDAVLDARVSPPEARPRLVPLSAPAGGPAAGAGTGGEEPGPGAGLRLEDYEGVFEFEDEEVYAESIPFVIGDMIGPRVAVERAGDRLLMTDNLGQKFYLYPRSPTEFLVEDMEIPAVFRLDAAGRAAAIVLDGRPGWKIAGRRIGGAPHE